MPDCKPIDFTIPGFRGNCRCPYPPCLKESQAPPNRRCPNKGGRKSHPSDVHVHETAAADNDGSRFHQQVYAYDLGYISLNSGGSGCD